MRYDLHMHSKYSRDSNSEPKDILKAARRAGLDGIAVTDHQSMKGGLATQQLNKDKDFEVIVAEEVLTDMGEILVYYLNEEIPKLPLYEALDEIRKQGAIASIAHPFSRGIFRGSFEYDIRKLKGKIHGLETWNARMLTHFGNNQAKKLADEMGIGETGGSDAHFLREIGRGWVEFEGSFEKAIKMRKTNAGGKVINALFYRVATLGNLIVKKL